ncbi:GntR family transcriptional regulator [Dactylosporangium darangshiense]|uniref:HTH gntR-type domain-containing protein n=1 Tax=Dactylosporangium darangshiense TaxID=579108 RepID=A0ABP8DMI0_9ACTN
MAPTIEGAIPLTALDPDSSEHVSQQIANVLRAAILTGELAPGVQLPSQPQLATHYGVARETVKRALEVLRSERLIVTRQGSGSFVRLRRQPPDILEPAIAAALTRPHVTIDFAGVSAEKLRDALVHVLDAAHGGNHRPKSITMRLALPAEPRPTDTAAPRPAAMLPSDGATRHGVELIRRLSDLEPAMSVAVQVQALNTAPMSDLYILNRQEAMFGFNPARPQAGPGDPERRDDTVSTGGSIPLFHYIADSDVASHATQFVASAQSWFDATWNEATSGIDHR